MPVPVPAEHYDGQGDLVLRPQQTSRLASLIFASLAPGAIFVAGAIEEANPLLWAVAAVLAGLGPRLWRYRVECSAGTIELHGVFRNRRIPAASVVRVDESTCPVIIWRRESGRVQSTPLYGFRLDNRILEYVYEHSRDGAARLRIWIDHNRGIA